MPRAGPKCAALAALFLLVGCRSMSKRQRPAASRASSAESPAASGSAAVKESARLRPEGRRLYVISGIVDVVDEASAKGAVLGAVRAGGAVLLRSPATPVGSDSDCPQGWYAIEPRGFVCGSNRTTDDAHARAVEVLGEYKPAPNAALPASYGIAEVTPVYLRVPTWDEQLKSEPGLEEHLHKRAALREAREAAKSWG